MLWVSFLLVASAHASCPEEQTKVVYPSEDIGQLQCTGRCKEVMNISCVGVRMESTDACYRWTCHHIPKSYTGYVTIDVPVPYDTIHIDVGSAPKEHIVFLVSLAGIMYLACPGEFLFGIACGVFLSSLDVDEASYTFDS